MKPKITLQQLLLLREIEKSPDSVAYGMALMQATGEQSGNIYPRLGFLEKKGFIKKVKRVPVAFAGAERAYYSLTQAGIDALEWVRKEFYDG